VLRSNFGCCIGTTQKSATYKICGAAERRTGTHTVKSAFGVQSVSQTILCHRAESGNQSLLETPSHNGRTSNRRASFLEPQRPSMKEARRPDASIPAATILDGTRPGWMDRG